MRKTTFCLAVALMLSAGYGEAQRYNRVPSYKGNSPSYKDNIGYKHRAMQNEVWKRAKIAAPDQMFSDVKKNVYTNTFRATRNNKTKVMYNPITREYKFAPGDSKLRYSLLTKKWTNVPESYVDKRNTIEHRWETVPKNSILKYNRSTKEYQYARPKDEQKYNPYNKRWEFPE